MYRKNVVYTGFSTLHCFRHPLEVEINPQQIRKYCTIHKCVITDDQIEFQSLNYF